MVKKRHVFYNAALLWAALLPAFGCGKPAEPPPGAPQNTSVPTVDLGTESGPKDSVADPTDSTPGNESPADGQGDQ